MLTQTQMLAAISAILSAYSAAPNSRCFTQVYDLYKNAVQLAGYKNLVFSPVVGEVYPRNQSLHLAVVTSILGSYTVSRSTEFLIYRMWQSAKDIANSSYITS